MRVSVVPLLLMVASVSVSGCAEKPDTSSAWLTIERAFSGLIAGDQDAEHYFAEGAYSRTTLLQNERSRYQFLHVEEMRFSAPETRQGSVALTLDDWPISLEFTIERDGTQWEITSFDSQRLEVRARGLLGLQGLPIVDSAPAWTGGLDGRDRHGRPNPGVLLVVLGGQVFIDNHQEIPNRASHVRNALRENIAARRQLAAAAKSTYRPHVAIAVKVHEKNQVALDLIEWSFEAGAHTVQLLTRTPDGQPGALTIGRVDRRLLPTETSWDLAVNWRGETLAVGARGAPDPLFDGPLGTLKERGALLSSRPEGKTMATALVSVDAARSHGELVSLLSLLQQRVPGIHVALESKK